MMLYRRKRGYLPFLGQSLGKDIRYQRLRKIQMIAIRSRNY